jgi:hypothetical protein
MPSYNMNCEKASEIIVLLFECLKGGDRRNIPSISRNSSWYRNKILKKGKDGTFGGLDNTVVGFDFRSVVTSWTKDINIYERKKS